MTDVQAALATLATLVPAGDGYEALCTVEQALTDKDAEIERLTANERHTRNLHDWRVKDLDRAQAEVARLTAERDEARSELIWKNKAQERAEASEEVVAAARALMPCIAGVDVRGSTAVANLKAALARAALGEDV